MKDYKSIFQLILLLMCFSCKNSNLDGGGSMDNLGNTTTDGGSSNLNGTPPEEQSITPLPKGIEMEDEMTDENGDIVDPNSHNQSSSSSSIFNAYQCSKCAFISNGTSEPAASSFNNCVLVNYSRLHSWNKISTNGNGEQCSNCGIKYYVGNTVVAYSFDGCANGNAHYWVEF
jgi:hypothetical protein